MALQDRYYSCNFNVVGIPIKARFKPAQNRFKQLSEQTCARLIMQSMGYIAQTDMGKAIIEVCASKEIKFWLKSNAAYDPNIEGGVVKWDPLSVMWVGDFGKSTGKRNRTKFANGFDGNLVVRKNDDEWALTGSNTDHVLEPQSAPAVLLHELGHMQQHIRRPHYFADEFKNQALKFKRHQIGANADDVNFHLAPDMDTPWEVDNINWVEIPFIKQLRAKGIMDGVRWAYGDGVSNVPIDDMETVRVGDGFAVKVKKGNSWYHLNEGWAITSNGTKKKSVTLKKLAAKQQPVTSALKAFGCSSFEPSAEALKSFYDYWLKQRA